MSLMIEQACDRHRNLKEQVECREADIFMTIPSLLVLRTLEEEKIESSICQRFYPVMFTKGQQSSEKYETLKEEYKLAKSQHSTNQAQTSFIIKS